MAAVSPRSMPAGPEWPGIAPDQRVVFLTDAASRVERRLIEQWIEENRPEEHAPELIELVSIPPSRRRRTPRSIDPQLEESLSIPGDPLMAPLRVIWRGPLRNGKRTISFLGLLTAGDPRDPNWIRQSWIRRRDSDRCVIVAGEPALASNLRGRWTEFCGSNSAETLGLAEFITQKATLALERAERRIRGARYKVPRLVNEEILGRPSFRGELSRIASRLRAEGDENASLVGVTNQAAKYIKEIAATHSPLVIDLVNQIIRWVYTRGYDEKLIYDETVMKGIAALEERHPVVFLPTHKSNLDHLVLQYALHEHGLPPNHTAGGINMNFFPLGPLVRRSGVFFIRRSFRDNPVYKHVLSHYIDYLIEKRFPLEWYIEGGRSRSGKLLPPRFGLLSNVVGAYQRGKSEDVYLVPVSIAYDQIQDVGSYVAEQRGGEKQTENFSWLVKFVQGLRNRYGQIHIAFGEPLSLRDQLGAPEAERSGDLPTKTPPATQRRFDLEKLAFEVSVRINQVTPITPTSLVTLALLGTTGQALTVAETAKSLENLLATVHRRNLPTSEDFMHLGSEEGIEATLLALVDNDVLTRFDGGLEPVYGISDKQQLTAAYYRNTVVHFFVGPAIAELALLHAIQGPREEVIPNFWKEVMHLRNLLKFEFFFSEKETFRDEIRQVFEPISRDWEKRIEAYEVDPEDLIRKTKPFCAHRVLRPFFESYRVVADQLAQLAPETELDEKRFLDNCLGLGRQYEMQKRIHATDSISKVLFQTALKLAGNRGLLGTGGSELAEARADFAADLHDAIRRVDIIVALAAGRRAGF
ncbi:MAG: glycerol-3-phosphate 1-O-acyltransferase [Myxococcota bacterium]